MVAMTVIDKLGRKRMLLVGALGTAASSRAWPGSSRPGHEHLLVWLLIAFIAFFAFSQGAVIWVYLSEVFPNRVRAKGQSLGSFDALGHERDLSYAFPVIAASSGAAPFVVLRRR